MRQLTEAQSAVLEFIRESLVEHQTTPTLREISERFGFAAQTGPQCHLRALARKGYITLGDDGRCRRRIKLNGVRIVLKRVRVKRLPAREVVA